VIGGITLKSSTEVQAVILVIEGGIMNLRLHCRRHRNAVVVYCTGKITFGQEAGFLLNQVAALLARRRHVILHFGGVVTIDAAGIGTLAGLAARARTSGSQIKICNLPEHIATLLDLTRMLQILKAYETEEKAFATWGEDCHKLSSSIPAVA
jgi:anti-anti-sigma factor